MLCAVLGLPGNRAAAAGPPASKTLETQLVGYSGEVAAGNAFESGQIHRYRLALQEGQFVRFAVEQVGVDVVVSLIGPDGRKRVELDSPTGDYGLEQLLWVAEVSGTYFFEVRPVDSGPSAGCYRLRIEELRASAQADRLRVDAEVELAKGLDLAAGPDIQKQKESLVRLRSALAVWRSLGDLDQEALTLHTMGELSGTLSEYDGAISLYSEALPIWRAAMDRAGEGYSLFLRGTLEALIAQVDEAFADYNESLAIAQQLHDVRTEAEVRSNLGRLHDQVGEKQKALQEYDLALPLTRATGNLDAEARTLSRLAVLYQSQGDKQKALNYGLQGLAVSRVLGNPQLESGMNSIVGRIYGDLSEHEAALRYLQAALKTVRAGGQKHPEARLLTNIGKVYAQQDQTAKAIECYRAALGLLATLGDQRWEAATLIFLGRALIRSGHAEEALGSFEKALRNSRAALDPYQEAEALTSLGAVYASRGSIQQALSELSEALILRRRVFDRLGEAATLYQVARIERGRGNLDVARRLSSDVLDAVESVRVQLVSPELRASLLEPLRAYYELYVDILVRLHEASGAPELVGLALQTSERARARSFLDLLTEARADIRRGVDPLLLAREGSLRSQLAEAMQLQAQPQSSQNKGRNSARRGDEIQRLTTAILEVGTEIREQSPQYASLTQPAPVELDAIQSALGPDTVLLEYFLGSEKSFLWVVTQESVSVHRLPDRSRVETLARRMYSGLAKAPAADKSGMQSAPVAPLELARILLGPAERQLKARRRVVIAADGALEYVPFTTLVRPGRDNAAGSGQLLIREHEIVSVPSASVLVALRREFGSRLPAPHILAVLADPVFERDDKRVLESLAGRGARGPERPRAAERQAEGPIAGAGVRAADRDSRLSRLPFTRLEGQAILDLVPVQERRAAFDFDASLDTAKSADLSRYRYVHFATHGFLDSARPELSGVVLSLVNADGGDQQGFLSMLDVFNLNLPSDLVVLSACRTALGKEIRGEGIVGLTRAFMYAGSPRVVASLWRVDDAATAELMKRFYEGMLGPGKLRPAAALREAQLATAKQKRWRDPYYWAAFVLQGEWR